MPYALKEYTLDVIRKLLMSGCFRNYDMSQMCTDAVKLQYVLSGQFASCHYMPRTF
jgi:hypothetical protein